MQNMNESVRTLILSITSVNLSYLKVISTLQCSALLLYGFFTSTLLLGRYKARRGRSDVT